MTEAFVEGTIDMRNDKLIQAIERHNELIVHQNTIFSKMLDELTLLREALL